MNQNLQNAWPFLGEDLWSYNTARLKKAFKTFKEIPKFFMSQQLNSHKDVGVMIFLEEV